MPRKGRSPLPPVPPLLLPLQNEQNGGEASQYHCTLTLVVTDPKRCVYLRNTVHTFYRPVHGCDSRTTSDLLFWACPCLPGFGIVCLIFFLRLGPRPVLKNTDALNFKECIASMFASFLCRLLFVILVCSLDCVPTHPPTHPPTHTALRVVFRAVSESADDIGNGDGNELGAADP